jgi:DNA-binding NarL/FixJ family response regulator
MIRVVLADDQEMVRTGFAMILGAQDDLEVVAECSDGEQALAAIEQHRPDVALLDIRMPGLDGLEVARRVAGITNVVIVTTFGHDEYVDQALDAGACGFLLKDSGPALLLAAVRAAAVGDALISPELTVPLLERTRGAGTGSKRPLPTLTDRELDVIRLVAQGRTNAEISAELHIALGTVKTHLSSIQSRLDARNRVEVAARAWESGLMG